ncbi:hypothetical protein PUNSTDRAFT_35156, partial [Punctularia strigosozonata HHB-11173 SS5]|uniref:uncharacterized protein n=1 Tax=Punctularia strigosozonata (strain HHB-11173) TaxID=741275 RepID=UPI00044172FA
PGVQTRRNLVVCLDGTANQFGEKSSNIVELYSRLVKDDSQLAYYSSGIGTYVKEDRKSTFRHWKQAVDSAVDQAIATSFEEIVHHAYRWLSDNYQRGDKIFLFGFSRGAYQARVIAGMIEKVGLLQKGNIDQINFAYSLYVKSTQSGGRDREERERGPVPDQDEVSTHERLGTESRQKIDKQNPFMTNPKNGKSSAKSNGSARQQDHASSPADLFKDTFSVSGARVHFVGAWDTVSSVGWIRGPSLPETTTGMSHVCVFRHALALDELRVKFLPEFANGGKGP